MGRGVVARAVWRARVLMRRFGRFWAHFEVEDQGSAELCFPVEFWSGSDVLFRVFYLVARTNIGNGEKGGEIMEIGIENIWFRSSKGPSREEHPPIANAKPASNNGAVPVRQCGQYITSVTLAVH